jgi:hypothetical protein
MVLLGIALGRLRCGFTFIKRVPLIRGECPSVSELPTRDSSSGIISYGQAEYSEQPNILLKRILSESKSNNYELQSMTIGLLSLPPLRPSEGTGQIDLVRVHSILKHELAKLCNTPIQAVTIGEARLALGINGGVSSEAKRQMIDAFQREVVIRDKCSTSSGVQVMAESFAVAMRMERARLLEEIGLVFPEAVLAARNQVLNQKVFQRSSTGVKMKESIYEELVTSEVNRVIARRFKI